MKPQAIITTSWDDGHKLDLRLAALLRKYHIKATLYVSPNDHEFAKTDLLTDEQVAELAADFEIGAHTMNHPRLTEVSDERARQEMADSKHHLEQVIGRAVTSFCYPGGNYRPVHAKIAQAVGFTYARTCARHAFGIGASPLLAPTSVNAYNHYQDLFKIWRFAKFNPFKVPHYFQWDNLAKAMFDKVRENGGVFHLWGHSWEIDQHGDWDKLEGVLRYISGHTDVTYATNAELTTLIKPRLLVVAPYFPPATGGVEHYSQTMALGAAAAGYEVGVITSGEAGQTGTVTEVTDGLTIWRLPVQFRVMNTPIHLGWYWQIKQIMRQWNPDIVNAHAPVPYLPDVAALAARGRRRITTYHSGSLGKGKLATDWLISLYEHLVLPHLFSAANRVICASQFVYDRLNPAYQPKASIITPGVELSHFPRRKHHTPGRKVLFVGHFRNGNKGLAQLIAAVAHIPNAHLDVVGDGPKVAHPRVTYHGILPAHELSKFYQAADVFVLPSTASESFGMVIVEAMASGTPVVASNFGGIPSIITDQSTGLLVPSGDVAALTAAISKLLDEPTLAAGIADAAYNHVVSTFTWQHSIQEYLGVLQDVRKDSV